MKSIKSVLLAAGLSILVSPLAAHASSGEIDANGGHSCQSNCEQYGLKANQYHYHHKWAMIDGKWKYYSATGAFQKGWMQSGHDWYYFNQKGVMQTGWVKVGGMWYYLQDNGKLLFDWLKWKSHWYFVTPNGMETGWGYIDDEYYFFGYDGIMRTGWLKEWGNWYYLNLDGSMKTGWLQQDNEWYYLNESGAMETGWFRSDDDTWYYAYPDGRMASNSVIDGYEVGGDGAWISELARTVAEVTDKYGASIKSIAEDTMFITINGEVKVLVTPDSILGEKDQSPMISELAILLGCPATKEELERYIDQALEDGSVITLEEYMVSGEYDSLAIMWGEAKKAMEME